MFYVFSIVGLGGWEPNGRRKDIYRPRDLGHLLKPRPWSAPGTCFDPRTAALHFVGGQEGQGQRQGTESEKAPKAKVSGEQL